MQVNWNKENDKTKNEAMLTSGDYEDMQNIRKKNLKKMQSAVEDALSSWEGQNIALVVIKEDENGEPSGSHVVMTGVSRLGSNVAMIKSLQTCAEAAVRQLMDSVKGEPDAMMQVAKALLNSSIEEGDK